MDKDQVFTVELPDSAARKQFRMRSQFGRDQVAAAVGGGGWNSFERPFPGYFFACAKLIGGAVFDVGANTGYYTLLAACASKKNNVFSFEPDQNILSYLKENLDLSGVRRQVRSFSLALSNKSGNATFFVPTQEHGLVETSSSLEATFKTEHSRTFEVKVDTLDNFIMNNCKNIIISIIKIDVEGHEPHVLTGAEGTVQMQRPFLFVEVLGRADLEFFSAFIRRHDYVDIPLRENGVLDPTDTVAFIEDAWNHAFIPRERSDFFVSLTAGLA